MGNSPLKFYLKVYFSQKPLLFALTFLSIIVSALAAVFPLIVSVILDRLASGASEFSDFTSLIVLIVALAVIEIIMRVLYSKTDWTIYTRGKEIIYEQFLKKILDRSSEFHTSHQSGALVSNSNKFLEGYSRTNTFLFDILIPIITSVVIAIGVLIFLSPLIGLLLVIVSAVYFLVSIYRRKKESTFSYNAAQKDSDVVGHISDSLTNIDTVISFGKQDYELSLHKDLVGKWRENVKKLIAIRMKNHAILFTLPAIGYILVLIAGIYAATEGNASIGLVYLAITYTSRVIVELSQVELAIPDFLESLDAAQIFWKM